MLAKANITTPGVADGSTVVQFPEDRLGPPRWQGSWRPSTLPDNVVVLSTNRYNRDLDSGEILALAVLKVLSRKKGFKRFFTDDVMRLVIEGGPEKGHHGRQAALNAFFDRDDFFGDDE